MSKLAEKLAELAKLVQSGADEVLAAAEGDHEVFEFVLKVIARSIKTLEDGANNLKEVVETEGVVTASVVKTADLSTGPTPKSQLIDAYNDLDALSDSADLTSTKLSLGNYLMHNKDSENAALYMDFIDNGADKYSSIIFNTGQELLEPVKTAILNEVKKLEQSQKSASDGTVLEKLISVATAFDESGDEQLQKAASVLDELLLTIAAPKGSFAQARAKTEAEVNRLREQYRDDAVKKLYSDTKDVHDEGTKAAAVEKAVADKKVYKPMEAPLSTRYCPDHPGVGVIRVADRVYQCSLDHKIYNYETGFTTMKGNQVPGGSVDQQTDLDAHGYGAPIFSTRGNS